MSTLPQPTPFTAFTSFATHLFPPWNFATRSLSSANLNLNFSNASSTVSNRWTFFVIGGTAIAVIVIGGTFREHHFSISDCERCLRGSSVADRSRDSSSSSDSNSRSRSDLGIKEDSSSPGGMFEIACYLAEKLSGLIPWMSSVGALNAERRTEETTKQLEGSAVELDERASGGGTTSETLESVEDSEGEGEVEKLRKLLEEARLREESSKKAVEEVEGLREEVGRLKSELDEEREKSSCVVEGRGKGKGKEVDRGPLAESLVLEVDLEDPYLRAVDHASEEEVIELLQSLNDGMSEVAQTITRAFASVQRPPPRLPSEEPSEDFKEAVVGVAEILGPRMVELLQSPRRQMLAQGGDEGTVKMALKASMAAYTHWIISSWYFENPEDEHLLSEIYARVRETEEQTVSGRWRALTRTHLQRMLATEPDLTIYMIDAFVNIILTAGWHNDATALQEYLTQTFGDKVGSVLDRAKRLNKMIGEEIVRCDLEALYIAPDVVFTGGTMEVGQLGRRSGSVVEGSMPERVLCTMDLGLVRAEKKMGRIGEWDEAVLLKPIVVLQSNGVGGV